MRLVSVGQNGDGDNNVAALERELTDVYAFCLPVTAKV
jgi:hypothetical protein